MMTLSQSHQWRQTFVGMIFFLLLTFMLSGFTGCTKPSVFTCKITKADPVSTPEALAQKEQEFLKLFDRLFKEDIADQSEEYKENIRHIILILARDLLQQVGKSEEELDQVLVERKILTVNHEDSQFSYSYLDYITEDKIPQLQERDRKALLYRWSIGIPNDNANLGNLGYVGHDPGYIGFLGIRDGKVYMMDLYLSYNACGGMFNQCCDGAALPLFYGDKAMREEFFQRVDTIPTLQRLLLSGYNRDYICHFIYSATVTDAKIHKRNQNNCRCQGKIHDIFTGPNSSFGTNALKIIAVEIPNENK